MITTIRKKKLRRKLAKSILREMASYYLVFDDGKVGGSRVAAIKECDGVFVDVVRSKHSFHLSPKSARMLGKYLIKWADELENK